MSQERLKREFSLSNLALNNRISIFIVVMILILFGLFAYNTIPKEQFPEVVLPTVTVQTIYPGNSPSDIESLITRPIEKELKSVKGIKTIKSSSVSNMSIISIEFNETVASQQATLDVKDAVDKAKKELPTDLDSDPNVKAIDLSEIPIILIHLSGDFEIEQLKRYAELLEDAMESLPEVAKVDIVGSIEKEIQVNVDMGRLQAAGLNLMDIEKAIANENIALSVGDVKVNNIKRTMRILGKFQSTKELESTIVSAEKGNLIYLKDIAQVINTYQEADNYSRLVRGDNIGKQLSSPVVSLIVRKKSKANLIKAAEKIDQIIAQARSNFLPARLSVEFTEDQSINIKRSIDNLENSIISGIILVVLVLLFFMGLRNALLVGIAIPLSMFMSFIIFDLLDYTLNIVILFGLILALGMLVDNGIVVVENIYRLQEAGYKRLQAAREGIGEVALAIISSTATTLAAFLPLATWSGLIGEFMKYLPITLIVVLSSSLFVALVITPVFSYCFMKVSDTARQTNQKGYTIIGLINISLGLVSFLSLSSHILANLFFMIGLIFLANAFILRPLTYWFSNKPLVWIEIFYLKAMRYALYKKRPYIIFLTTFVLLIISLIAFVKSNVKTILFPSNEPEYAYILIETPIGSHIEHTNDVTKTIETRLYAILEPYKDVIKSVVINVATNTTLPSESLTFTSGTTPNKSKVTITFVPFEERGDISSGQVLKEIGETLRNIPGVQIFTDKQRSGPPVGKAINIEFTGEDYPTLIRETQMVKKRIEEANIPGIDGLSIELEIGKPELVLEINRAKARQVGMSTGQISSTLRTALYGKEVSKFKDGEGDYPILLRLDQIYRDDISHLMEQQIVFRDKRDKLHKVPISAVASLKYTNSFGVIKRKDLKRLITVSSNVIKGYNANRIIKSIRDILDTHPLPSGYNFQFTGEQEEQAKSMDFLVKALLIAVSSIFLILVSQFNSLIKPFIILISVLFSLVGVLLGIVGFQMDFVVIMTGVGIISLAGVVVNNCIVLIDCIDFIRRRKQQALGLDVEAHLPTTVFIECLIEGGITRFRPVILTAITTILGLIPLATGLNIDFFSFFATYDAKIFIGGENVIFWGPMAWTVIFGLFFATFLTLIIVPLMYLITDRINSHIKKYS